MLPVRPLYSEPAPPPQIIERQVDDPRVWELQERVIRIETDRRWLNTALCVVFIGAGILAPGVGIWMSERRASQYSEETARIELRVSELDQDVGELLTAVLSMAKESAEETRATAASPIAKSRGPAAPTGSRGSQPERQPTAQEWAETLGGQILLGSLGDADRASLRAQWQSLPPDLQQQTLTALLRRYGLDPETFLSAMED